MESNMENSYDLQRNSSSSTHVEHGNPAEKVAPSTTSHTSNEDGTLCQDPDHAISVSSREEHYLDPNEWLDWYDRLCQAVITVAALGAAFTFSVMLSPLAPAAHGSADHVRFCLILSWMLFIMALIVTSIAGLFFNVNRKWFAQGFENRHNTTSKRSMFAAAMVLALEMLPLAAFLASAQAVEAYEPAVGRIVTWMTCATAGILFLFWIAQNSKQVRKAPSKVVQKWKKEK